jgi:hypothetical protein
MAIKSDAPSSSVAEAPAAATGSAVEVKAKREMRQRTMPDKPISAPLNFFDAFQYVIEIVGLGTLITHSKKGVHIGEAGTTLKGKSRPPFDILGAFKDAFYPLPGAKMPTKPIPPNGFWPYFPNRFGFLAKAFKDALITILSQETQLHKDLLGQRISVIGFGSKDPNMVVLKYSQVKCRYEHLPNPSSFPRTLMPVSRPEFFDWSTKIVMKVPQRILMPSEFCRFLTLAGTNIGVGDSRKEKSKYEHGTFALGKVQATKIDASEFGFKLVEER